MDEQDWKRLKGLTSLLHDGVERGADFVEKQHRQTAAKPFAVLESVAILAAPTRAVRVVHDGVSTLVYGGLRAVNRLVKKGDTWALEHMAPADADDCEDSRSGR